MRFSMATLAISLIAAASAAFGQTAASKSDGTKPRPEPPTFYQPYTGPGFGNPDADAKQEQPVGRSRKKYNDAPGTSAYSRGGSTEPAALNPVPKGKTTKKGKAADKAKHEGEAADPAPASPPVSEKR